MNWKYFVNIFLIICAFALLAYWLYLSFDKCNKISSSSATKIQIQSIMNNLWTEHAFWTRMCIMCISYGFGDRNIYIKRLMQNNKDIGDAFGVFYGSKNGKKITELLNENSNITINILDAVLIGDQIIIDTESAHWKTNADDISIFLSSDKKLQEYLYEYIELTTQEMLAIYYKDNGGDIKAFDKIIYCCLVISKMLTDDMCSLFNIK